MDNTLSEIDRAILYGFFGGYMVGLVLYVVSRVIEA